LLTSIRNLSLKKKSELVDKMAKKTKKTKPSSKKYALYESSGSELKRKNKFCPKCGDGVFLAKHKDRLSCGKCQYTEFMTKDKKE